MQPGFTETEPASPEFPALAAILFLLELGIGGQSTGRAEEARVHPPSYQLTLHVLHTQHQVDKVDEVHLEVGAAVADKHQLADVITEHDSCREHRLPPWVLGPHT